MKREKAQELFKNGYNCCQSVVLAFEEEIGIERSKLEMLAGPFGGGMGRMREVCGAVSGMFMVLGFLDGYQGTGEGGEKAELYKKVQLLAEKFKEKNGTIICGELLGLKGPSNCTPDARTPEYYKKRPCVEMVGDAAEIIENYLNNKN